MVNASDDIKNQAWFRGVDWKMVEQKKIQPPWVPELQSNTDCQYFDQYPDNGVPIEEPSQENQALFDDF